MNSITRDHSIDDRRLNSENVWKILEQTKSDSHKNKSKRNTKFGSVTTKQIGQRCPKNNLSHKYNAYSFLYSKVYNSR